MQRRCCCAAWPIASALPPLLCTQLSCGGGDAAVAGTRPCGPLPALAGGPGLVGRRCGRGGTPGSAQVGGANVGGGRGGREMARRVPLLPLPALVHDLPIHAASQASGPRADVCTGVPLTYAGLLTALPNTASPTHLPMYMRMCAGRLSRRWRRRKRRPSRRCRRCSKVGRDPSRGGVPGDLVSQCGLQRRPAGAAPCGPWAGCPLRRHLSASCTVPTARLHHQHPPPYTTHSLRRRPHRDLRPNGNPAPTAPPP